MCRRVYLGQSLAVEGHPQRGHQITNGQARQLPGLVVTMEMGKRLVTAEDAALKINTAARTQLELGSCRPMARRFREGQVHTTIPLGCLLPARKRLGLRSSEPAPSRPGSAALPPLRASGSTLTRAPQHHTDSPHPSAGALAVTHWIEKIGNHVHE